MTKLNPIYLNPFYYQIYSHLDMILRGVQAQFPFVKDITCNEDCAASEIYIIIEILEEMSLHSKLIELRYNKIKLGASPNSVELTIKNDILETLTNLNKKPEPIPDYEFKRNEPSRSTQESVSLTTISETANMARITVDSIELKDSPPIFVDAVDSKPVRNHEYDFLPTKQENGHVVTLIGVLDGEKVFFCSDCKKYMLADGTEIDMSDMEITSQS